VKVYAFVFARGGSKGLPGKNIRKLGGIPLLGHSIRIAKQVPAVEKVLVSTDAQDIAQVAREYGAEVIERPQSLATDSVAEWLAWKHAIEHVRGRGEQFDVLLSLPATSPLRSVGDVENCLAALDDATDVVITVTPAGRNPYFNMVTRDERGYSSVVMQGKGFVRRQDAPQVYDITTVAYVAHPDYVLRSSGLFEGRVKSVIVPKERAADIDDAYDFLVAEALYGNGSDRNGS
jgi:CMP-N-acetylneuraminic acid synthetase